MATILIRVVIIESAHALELIIGVLYLAILIFLAPTTREKDDPSPWYRLALIGLPVLMIFLGTNVLLAAVAPTELAYDITRETALIYAGFAATLSGMAWYVIQKRTLRIWVSRFVLPGGTYDPDRATHTVAVVVALFMIVYTGASFVLLGGLDGIADAISQSQPGLLEISATAFRFVAVAFIGVGALLHRDINATLDRLGLTVPTWREFIVGLGMGLLAFGLMIVGSIIWTLLSSPEAISSVNETSMELVSAYGDTLLMALLFAFLSGFSEELLFRGAIQPVFGLIPTSIFFGLMHVQYWFTPAILIIVVVGLLFGWLRMRYSTTSAITAHLVYNFLPFLLISVLNTTS